MSRSVADSAFIGFKLASGPAIARGIGLVYVVVGIEGKKSESEIMTAALDVQINVSQYF